ncbi:uncharacterized protein F5891DRAFT_1194421 [Suillus fuscotomentosus]|uniref:Fungal-type protein kinase domain-containing protein n=1 Tax=Suillus fuscotomentosus TaxID=1912939 RepID=A0AAD4HG09_9AGAM|nr:uncharacterized protein F5891DRAFT_1194421 [Suillus fuscotomentosus]KAG1895213.1 hypothetical protein F5891DRAFT_1194421 [Suillus fuscotomentosus]
MVNSSPSSFKASWMSLMDCVEQGIQCLKTFAVSKFLSILVIYQIYIGVGKIAYVAWPTNGQLPLRLLLVSVVSALGNGIMQDATATTSSGYDIAQGQPSICSLISPSLIHNFRQRIDSSWGVDMKHHFKHRDIDSAMKAEIGSLLICDLPWCDNRLIDVADEFLSPTQCNTMIQRWARPNGVLTETKGTYEWTAASKAPLPLQRKNWLEEAGTPLDQTFESCLTNFFNEITIQSRRYKNYLKKGGAIPEDIGLRVWKAFNRTALEATRSPDIILISRNSEESKWAHVISIMEVKWEDSPRLLMSAITQLADKATFVFHHQPHRQWFPCLSLCGTALRLSVFTRGRSLHSEALDISSDPKLFSKVMNYFTEADFSWLGYDVHIFRVPPAAVQVWDDKRYWQDEEENGAPCDDSEFHLVGYLHRSIGLHGKGTRVFTVEGAHDKKNLVIKDCWDPSKTVSDHVIHGKLQDPTRDSLLIRSPNGEWVFTGGEDSGDCLDRECAQRLDGIYCYVGSRCWDNVKFLPGITIMQDHMHPSIGLFFESPVPQSVTSICASMIPSQVLAKVFDESQGKIQLEERHRSRTSFTTCGVDISWFGTARCRESCLSWRDMLSLYEAQLSHATRAMRAPSPRFTMYTRAHVPTLARPIAPAIQMHPSTVHQAP